MRPPSCHVPATKSHHFIIMCRFYLSQGGPLHPKHGGGYRSSTPTDKRDTLLPPLHPFLAFSAHYTLTLTSTFMIHDAFFDFDSTKHSKQDISYHQDQVAFFVFVYVQILFGCRYLSSFLAGKIRQHAVLYELTWMCNSTLVLGFVCFGGLGNILRYAKADILMNYRMFEWFCRKRPLVVTASCVAVSVDQVFWYVDLAGWAITRKFLIGVTKYLTWKQTLWIDKLTCTHHLWTIPLLFFGAGEVNFDSYFLSIHVVLIQVILSRWLTPHHIRNTSFASDLHNMQSDPIEYRYLNVNLSHEVWKDISFSFLQISVDKPSYWLYLFRLLWRWQLLNLLVFIGVLLPLNNLIN